MDMGMGNISRRAFLAGAGTVLASVTVPLAAPTRAFGANAAGKIVVLGTNDTHGTLENPVTKLGYAALKNYADSQRAEVGADRVTLVDSGDIVQGNPTASLSKGAFPAKAVAACGYDVIVPGNHEFDYGVSALQALANTEGAAYTCCNFTDTTGACVFEKYHVVEYTAGTDKIRVAYIGVTTPSTRGSSANFKDQSGNFIYDFAIDTTGEALYKTVQAAVDEARSVEAADYVVLLAHLGQSWSPKIWRSDTLVANTNGIDAVLDAHTHQLYVQSVANKDGQAVPIVQAGSKFLSFARLEIDLSARTATASAVATGVAAELVKTWDGSDAEVANLVADINRQVDDMVSGTVGISEVNLVALKSDGSQAAWTAETNLGDLVADAILYTAKVAGTPCDIAFYDGFGICADIPVGTVGRRAVLEAVPCGRQIFALEVSGQHLLDMLEVASSLLPEPEARLLQTSRGFSYTVRTDIASPVEVSPATHGFVAINGTRRVTSASLDGEAIDPAGRYTVAMPKGMLVSGGWSMPVPENASAAVKIALDSECLLAYVQDEAGLDGTIGSEYATAAGNGRIVLTSGNGDKGDGDKDNKGDNTDGENKGGESNTDDGENPSPTPTPDPNTQKTGSKSAAINTDVKHNGPLPATDDNSLAAAAAAVLAGAAMVGLAAMSGDDESQKNL